MAGQISGPGYIRGMPSPGNAGGFASGGVIAPTEIPGFSRPGAPIDADRRIIGGTTGDDGVAKLIAGRITVVASISAGDSVNLERVTPSGVTGNISATNIVNGSFQIDSDSAGDTSLVRWQVVRVGK